METLGLVLAVVAVPVVLLTVWVGRRQRRISGSSSGNDRLGVKDPRDTPWGPSSGL